MVNPFYLSLGKSAVYFTESLPLLILSQLYVHGNQSDPPKIDELKILFKEIYDLHKWDHQNIKNGMYPKNVVSLGSPLQHTLKLARVFSDAVIVARRMKDKKHKDFSEQAQEYLENLPDYYSRNFHFQTDGYLSEKSAQIYDHQVEILFNGTAQTMRRLTLPPLRDVFSPKDEIEILDVACGPGSLTRDLALTFPKARITALDLSFPYLKEAQRRLHKFPRVNFLQGNAEKLPFKDHSFDAITCSFLFHELPQQNRKLVLQDCLRVLKPNGVLSLVDSIQKDDAPHLNWALERFPISYHEPFYKNYLLHPLEEELRKLTTSPVHVLRGFFSKSVSMRHESTN
jgi:ubiquinone/menaquinone biosynthesis C-methylase UbiE